MENLTNGAATNDTRDELTRALHLAEEATSAGAKTIETLALQEETLRGAEDSLESNEYVLNNAMKTLRGMSWGGLLYNLITLGRLQNGNTSQPIGVDNKSGISDAQNGPKTHPINCERSADDSHTVSNKAMLLRSSPTRMDGDEDVLKLLEAVNGLKDMSVIMSKQLDMQNTLISRIEEKTERVDDKTLAVTLKATQLVHQSTSFQNAEEWYVGTYEFAEKISGRYFSVDASMMLTLVDRRDNSTCFEVYRKGETLFGLKNAKTLTFLGTTIWGIVNAASPTFGKRQECHIKLNEIGTEETGIFFLASNWGAGGWLKLQSFALPANPSTSPATSPATSPTTATIISASPASEGTISRKEYVRTELKLLTTGISDKKDCLVLIPRELRL